jgi:hypothetical protein
VRKKSRAPHEETKSKTNSRGALSQIEINAIRFAVTRIVIAALTSADFFALSIGAETFYE